MTKPRLYALVPLMLQRFRVRLIFVLTVLAALVPPTLLAAQEPPCGACLAAIMTPGQILVLPERLGGIDLLVDAAKASPEATDAALTAIAARGGRPGLFLTGLRVPDGPQRVPGAVRVVLVGLTAEEATLDADALAYTLKTLLTALRGRAAAIEVGVSAPSAVLQALLQRDLGPYVDFVASSDGFGGRPSAATGQPATTLGPVVWRMADDGRTVGMSAMLARTREEPAHRWVWRMPAGADAAFRFARDLAKVAEWVPAGLVAPSTVSVRCNAAEAETFLNPQTLETVAIARRCSSSTPLSVTPLEPGVERLVLEDETSIVRVPAPGATDRFASGVDVVGARRLTVEEIVARHQAAVARQAAAVTTLISTGTLTLTFEAPGFPAPVTISSETILYSGNGRTELEQRSVRVNGIAFAGGGVPRLPIIEPERAAAPPLTITLSDLYRYRLDGEADVAGTRAYVIEFEPIDRQAPLFSGRVWIAMDSFAMVKVAAAQTGLRGAIVASEQVDEYTRHADGIWLLARSDVRQMYEGAAHRTPIHRVLSFATHEINAPAFADRRRAAYASNAVMLRDTPEGFRYLRRDPATASNAAGVDPIPDVAGRADRVRTLAAGVIIDPNISRPLPFAGISYVDFNLFGTGTQVNAFFGGAYGQLAFSVPSISGSRWQLAGRAFAIASSYNDRAFIDGRELYDRNIRQRPAHASVWLLRPITPRIALRVGYDLDYTHFGAAETTGAGFTVPVSQLVHGARFAIDGQRGGWNASLWWNPAVRSGWRAWGVSGSGDYSPAHRTFQRYGGSVSRSAVVTPGLAARVEGAWMGGQDLDRFSRYAFGTFDNRLRGYPSALIRYDRGGVLRGAIAWSVGPLLRIDGFLDTATVRDPGFGRGFRNYTGVGGALEAPAPFGLLMTAEWGYGIRGVNADGSRGTHVIRISAFKIF